MYLRYLLCLSYVCALHIYRTYLFVYFEMIISNGGGSDIQFLMKKGAYR